MAFLNRSRARVFWDVICSNQNEQKNQTQSQTSPPNEWNMRKAIIIRIYAFFLTYCDIFAAALQMVAFWMVGLLKECNTLLLPIWFHSSSSNGIEASSALDCYLCQAIALSSRNICIALCLKGCLLIPWNSFPPTSAHIFSTRESKCQE
jgi:hypothetical protein